MMAQDSGDLTWAVLIPAYNEERTIRSVVEGALSQIDRVIVVDDGSTDHTITAIRDMPVEVVHHVENRGKGWRLAEGLDEAAASGASHIVTLDADRQHDPADLPAFMAATVGSRNALIMGQRSEGRDAMPWWRAASIAIGDFFITWAVSSRVRDAQCGMRVYPAGLWQGCCVPTSERAHFVFETMVLIRAVNAGFPLVRVPIRAQYANVVIRRSYFRPMIDGVRIAGAIFGYLIKSGLNPKGFLIALGVLK